MARDSLDDVVLLVGLGIVGAIAYNEWYRGKSVEEVATDIDSKLRVFLDDIASKLPALPPVPQFTPPSLIPQSAAEPYTPTEPTAPPTNTAIPDQPKPIEPPVKPSGSGQLAKNPAVPPPPTGSGGAILAFVGDFSSNA